jgi:hypothetical protein
MRRLLTGLLSLAISLVFMTVAIPAHATLADAQWVCAHQSTHTAAQIAWAETLVPGCVVTPTPAPDPTPVPPAPPSGMKVTSSTGLLTALMNAKGGETFTLAPGSYSITLSSKSYAAPVTITSADLSKPAVIGWLKLTNVSQIAFRHVEIARKAANPIVTEALKETLAKVSGGSNITLDYVHFHGSLDGDATNDVSGIAISGVSNLSITNSEFQETMRALQLGANTNVLIAHNDVHNVRSDGFDLAQCSRVTIDGNWFHDFDRGSADHPDAIQFWTQGTTRPSTDIVIINNRIETRGGTGMQGIFLADQVGNLPYERVRVENNIVIGKNMPNGIFPSHVNGLTVRNNTVVSPVDDSNPVWIRVDRSTGVSVIGNIADMFNGVSASGNKLTSASGIDLKLLTTANVAKLTAAQLIVPGIGYQPQ